MENTPLSLTTIMLFVPLLGMIALLFFRNPEREGLDVAVSTARADAIRYFSLAVTIVTFVASVGLALAMNAGDPGLQYATTFNWIPAWGISYYVAVDGLSMLLVLLTTVIMIPAVLISFGPIRQRIKLYYALLLLLEWAMIGVFVAQDLFLFYIFWEVTLIPMYFLIGIWGAENRVYAAVKFFLYTMAGSILMLLAILFLGNLGGTFAVPDLVEGVQTGRIAYPEGIENLLFVGFAIAFAIKVPIWPLHSWLPDAHVQAPTAGSVILAGVLLKMGTYGFVRFNLPLFPQASVDFAPLVATLAVIGIIYGAWVSYGQDDAKKLVAYSSVSHLGFVMLGIFALNSAGIQGGVLQMVNHGLSTGALFIIVGMLYDRRHSKALDAFGGVWKALPIFGGISLIVALSSMGLPGLNGFVGEFTILLGSMGSEVLGFFFTFFAAIGVILAAVYILYMFQRIFMGPERAEVTEHMTPIRWWEYASLLPLLALIFWIGIFPQPFFGMTESAIGQLVTQVGPFIQAVVAGG